MTDDMLRMMLNKIVDEQAQARTRSDTLSGMIGTVANTCMRIDSNVTAVGVRLDDLRHDHDLVVVEMKKTDRVMMGRICKIEDQAVWVRGWAAGAAAAVGIASGAFIWLLFKFPSAVAAMRHIGGE